MCIVSGFVNSAANKNRLGFVSEDRSRMMQFSPLWIGKWHAVLLGFHAGMANMKIVFECQSKGNAKIHKEVDL